MHGFGERSAWAAGRKCGFALAFSLAVLTFTPAHALAVCGDTTVDVDEECDDGNVSGGDCCSASCSYEAGGAACTDDGEVCTTDLCDGAGACVHAAGNAGTECRPDGRLEGLGAVAAGVLELPVAISDTWFETHECGDAIQLYPLTAGTCSAWHVYNSGVGTAANLKARVNGIAAGTYTPPAATAGGITFNLVGGTISSALADIQNLFQTKAGSGAWTVRVPVFIGGGCSQFSSALQVIGFATARVTMDANNTIAGFIDCVTTTGTAGTGDFGTVVHTDLECDVPETCNGVSTTCPVDAHEPGGTPCAADAAICTADVCDSAGTCTHSGGNVGTVCRAAAGACDVPETCFGAPTCPADAKSTAVCRVVGGVCDLAETCDGTSNSCPADLKSTAACRAASGVCDLAETCDGTNSNCPADAFAGSGTCRASSGVCDPAETCNGISATCPADARSTAVCRDAAGVCDAAESCDGVASACPVDDFRPASSECRASGGVCDAAETCTGTSATCPSDVFANGTTCRNAAGVCDLAETCTGASAACPSDAFVVGNTCRSSAGECDAAESCSGASAACPADAIAPPGTPCGDPTAAGCHGPDTCDMAGECEENNFLPGTACEDDDLCTMNDTCDTDGDCMPGPEPRCDDGNPCTADECAPATGDCTFEVRPADDCRAAGKSSLTLSTRGDGKARWKWTRGEATLCEDLGAPDAETGYDVCIYDGAGGGEYELAAHFALPASGLWERGGDCRWTYKDRSGATDGITSMKLTPREQGRASIQLSVEGEAAPLPVPVAADRYMSSDPDVTVQISNSAGACWESRLTEARKNTGESYKGAGAVESGETEAP